MIDLLYTATPVISNIMSTFGDYTLFVAYKVRSELDLKARFILGCSFICFTLVVPRDETICCVLSIEYATYTLFLLIAIDTRKLTYGKIVVPGYYRLFKRCWYECFVPGPCSVRSEPAADLTLARRLLLLWH